MIPISRFIRILKADLHRAFLSPYFFLGVLVVCAAFFLGSSTNSIGYGSTAYTFHVTYSVGEVLITMLIGIPLAYSACFASELSNGYFRPAIIRSSINSYAISKCTATALSGGASGALGSIMFIIYLLIREPYTAYEDCLRAMGEVTVESTRKCFGRFGDLIALGGERFGEALYLAAWVYLAFLVSMLFAVLGLCVSAYIPNKYAACASPFLLYFVINRGTHLLNIPYYLDPVRVGTGIIPFSSTYSGALLYITLFYIILTVLVSCIFVRAAKRRLSNA